MRKGISFTPLDGVWWSKGWELRFFTFQPAPWAGTGRGGVPAVALGGRDAWGQREGQGLQEEPWGCSSGVPESRIWGKAKREGLEERRNRATPLGTGTPLGSTGHAVATPASREPRSARWQEAPAMPCSPGFLLGSEGVISARIAEEARAALLLFLRDLPCKWHVPERRPAC